MWWQRLRMVGWGLWLEWKLSHKITVFLRVDEAFAFNLNDRTHPRLPTGKSEHPLLDRPSGSRGATSIWGQLSFPPVHIPPARPLVPEHPLLTHSRVPAREKLPGSQILGSPRFPYLGLREKFLENLLISHLALSFVY